MNRLLAIAARALGLAAMVGLTTAAPASASTEVATENWNGYVTTGPATEVVAFWTVPSLNVLLSVGTSAAEWIGLGGGPGPNPTALVQIGTHEQEPGSWSPVYQVIDGSYNPGPVYGTQTLKAGDSMESYVVYYAGGHYFMSLYDKTRGWTWAFNVYNAGDRTPTSGEWVVESGTLGTLGSLQVQAPLSDFGTFKFTDMLFVRPGGTGQSLTDADVTRLVAAALPLLPHETSVSDISNYSGTITWQSYF